MKVLILSCNTGGGHNAAASALKESLNFYHHEAEVLDLMSLGRKHTSALVGGAYVKLVSVFPAGFGALYQLGTEISLEIPRLLRKCAAWKCACRLY